MSGSIGSILNNAASGLQAAQAGIAVISDNVAAAGVAGDTAKHLSLSAFDVGGQSSGVRTGLVTRSVDAALQASVWSSSSDVGALTVQSQVLGAINDTQGVPGAGTSLADTETALESSFTALQAQPSSQAQQSAVVAAASTLATAINNTAGTVTAQRNAVQAQIVSSVSTLNVTMDTIQSTTNQLITAISAGTNSSGILDQRDAALQTLSGLMNVHFSNQDNGNISILGQNGLSIPLTSRFSTQTAVLSPQASYTPGGTAVPPIQMQSSSGTIPTVDVTDAISGGTLGALIHQRDVALPATTTSLDAFSAKLANSLSQQGLQLFTDGTGTTGNLSAYAGLSSQITVNPAVVANPALVRDGTPTLANTTNLASFSGVINNVVNNSFAATGLIPSLSSSAQSFVTQQSTATGQATTNLTNATAYQSTLATRFSGSSGVNVDNEMGMMIQLQNSYQANARVVQTAQAMFTALLNATNTSGV